MSQVVSYHDLEISMDKIAEFCRRWKVTELALFGSILRDDFRLDSDIDVMVTFRPDASWRFYDLVDCYARPRFHEGRLRRASSVLALYRTLG